MRALGFLGFGEAGQAMAASLHRDHRELALFAYDRLRRSEQECACGPLADRVRHLPSPEALASSAGFVISVVTADQSHKAASAIAPFLGNKHVFADGNSVSPGTKRRSATAISANGAAYIDLAIMQPITPLGHRTPVLLAGPRQHDIVPIFEKFAFSFNWEGADIGQASTIKMLRSILIKGMESLICESMTAAEGLGLGQRILQSAGKTLGIENMPALADYVMARVVVHGRRRAAEMREAAKTLEELGLSNDMASATAIHQDRIADMELDGTFQGRVPGSHEVLAALMRKHQEGGQ